MKLLLAVDGSDEAGFAVREVARRPWPRETHVRVISVMTEDPAAVSRDVPVPSAPLSEVPPWPAGTLQTRVVLDEQARQIALSAVEILAAAGISADVCVREGVPGSEIVEEARRFGAELIVLGSRRPGPIKRLLWGSVTNYVLNHAACSIEVLRAPG